MVAGGYDGSTLSSIEVLSSESSIMSNKKLAELPDEISGKPSLFLHDDKILLCGGRGNENKCLMHENNAWKEHSTLNEYRMFASAMTTADGTYIFGGDGSKVTFEFLAKNSKAWREGRTKILDGFTRGCAVEVPLKREILLIGGLGPGPAETRILKFDIESSATFEVVYVSLIKERVGHTCARLPDTNLIVIAGSYNSDTVEFLNLDDYTITLGNPMNTLRRYHGMAVITIDNEDRLAVFGGNDENDDFLDSVETLNSRTRNWEVSDLKLKVGKETFGYISVPNDVILKL